MRALLLPTTGFSKGSLYPFTHYSQELKAEYGLEFQEIVSDDLKEKIKAIRRFTGDLIIFSVPWDFGTEGVLDFVKEAKRIKGQAKLVFFDYLDGNESRFWEVMPHVDLYLKQYLHRDMNKYQQRFTGASEFVQFQVESGRVEDSITEEVWTNLFQSDLDPAHSHKVMLGWNFGLWQRMIMLAEGNGNKVLWAKDKLHKRMMTLMRQGADWIGSAMTGETKPIDVFCRATLYKGWTRAHRTEVIDRLNRLPDSLNVRSSIEKVGFSEYYREMVLSKIFVSPSGWCEYTPKDYEAMYFKALLFKPCVEHIDTHPDILRPNETYVPVKWDLSDLEQKVLYYLNHDEERIRITENAHKAFTDYFKQKQFVTRVGEILNVLSLSEQQPSLLEAA